MGYNGNAEVYYRNKNLDLKEVFDYIKEKEHELYVSKPITLKIIDKIIERINEGDVFEKTLRYNSGEEDETDNEIFMIVSEICNKYLILASCFGTSAEDFEERISIIGEENIINKKAVVR